MSGRYARVPNPSVRHPHHELDDEVEAAFDYREDDEDDDRSISESHPLNRNVSQAPPAPRSNSYPPANVPGAYNFETVDYDYPPPGSPPPGSPPPLSSHALPNDFGNSNGMIPDFNSHQAPHPRRPWWQRTASTVLPLSVASLLGVSSDRHTGFVGGGTNNDGVFANVTAKPAPPVRIQNGDETYVVPEDVQQEAPPSYASAQADAVPPYWETTIHAPFSPESMGEMIVDSLPTGSFFAFCWNMLVSISFQFIGFLLTYLLHTSHAARLGSRAGLGVTLIQYGFALRGKLDKLDNTGSINGSGWSDWKPSSDPRPTSRSTSEAYRGLSNITSVSIPAPNDQTDAMLVDATAEWLSFFLMTIGWFILLTSVLAFYRVKRWERSILATQQQRDAPISTPATSSSIEQNFALRGMSRIELLRNGFGFSGRRDPGAEEARTDARAEDGDHDHAQVNPHAIDAAGLDPNDPSHQRILETVDRERRLIVALRSANLL